MKIIFCSLLLWTSLLASADTALEITTPHSSLRIDSETKGYQLISQKGNTKHVKKITTAEFERLRNKFYDLVLRNEASGKKTKCSSQKIKIDLRTLKESSEVCAAQNLVLYQQTKGALGMASQALKIVD